MYEWEIGDDLKDPDGEVYYTSIIRYGDGKLTRKRFVLYFNPETKIWEKYQVCVISKQLNISRNWFTKFIKSPDNFKIYNVKNKKHKFKKIEDSSKEIKLYDSVINANNHIMQCCRGERQHSSGYKWRFNLERIEGERWRKDPITNLKVSNKGRIRTLKFGHITLGSPQTDGYLRMNTARSRTELVHILCARVWLRERQKDDKGRYEEVHHKNKNRSDNDMSNLRYISIDDHRRLTQKESSEESEENIYNRNCKRRKKVGRKIQCINNITGEILFFDSIADAVENLKITTSRSNISVAARKNGNSGYYKWSYVEQEDLPGEIWKKSEIRPVEVSSHGRIRRRGNQIISEFTLGSSSCYYMYSGKLVHVLVANAFLGPPPLDELGRPYQIDHTNQNKLDNHYTNLEYLSIKDHAIKTANDNKGLRVLKIKTYELE